MVTKRVLLSTAACTVSRKTEGEAQTELNDEETFFRGKEGDQVCRVRREAELRAAIGARL